MADPLSGVYKARHPQDQGLAGSIIKPLLSLII
jgi:hypothetical protein